MKSGLVFIAGMAAGAVVTWYMTKSYYQRIADEEIESVKEEFLKDEKKEDTTESKETQLVNDRDEYEKKLIASGYLSNEDLAEQHGGAEPGIELIPPDQCGDDPSYGFDVLNYYSDGVLAVERNDEIIRDIQGTVSELALRSFGTWEKDSICVRNDNDSMYYEINRFSCTYEQAVGIDPEEEG